MLAEVGLSALALAFALASYAVVASLLGETRMRPALLASGRKAALLTFPALLLATAMLTSALMTEQYQLSYVWSVTDPQTPAIYRFTALWGSQRGSLLFWSLLLSLFTFGAIRLNWRAERRLMPYATATMMATLAFFLGLSLFLENPFERWWILPGLPQAEQVVEAALIPPGAVAPDGGKLAATATGLNPLLRHFGMIIHPPMLYLGFVGFTIPFAFALSALLSGELSTGWITITRRWTLIAWILPESGADFGRSLGLRCAGMGRLLGLGSGGKRGLSALAGGHGLHPQRHDPGKARHAQDLEYGAGDRDLFRGDVRHLCDAQRRHRERAQFRAQRGRLPDAGLLVGDDLDRGQRIALSAGSR